MEYGRATLLANRQQQSGMFQQQQAYDWQKSMYAGMLQQQAAQAAAAAYPKK